MAVETTGGVSGLDERVPERLRAGLRGDVLGPGDAQYDDARAICNAMIDKRPAMIARCVDAGDVITAVNLVRDSGLEVAVMGGRHSGPGLCLAEGGLTIDLSRMRWVRIDPEARIAQVGGGSQIGDLDHAAHAFGLGVPAGIFSLTGVGGLTLGSAAFPRFDRNPGTGEPPATATRLVPVDQEVFHDPSHASHILLPTVPRA
jgi:hypothetical protein